MLKLIAVTMLATASGCHYFDIDYQHEPTGFSSTHHQQMIHEKARQVFARQEKRRKLAEHHRQQAENLKRMAEAVSSTRDKYQKTAAQNDSKALH